MPSMTQHHADGTASTYPAASIRRGGDAQLAARTSITSPPKSERGRHILPIRPRASAYAWLTVLGLMLLAACPLLIGLNQQGTIATREARAIATADETLRRQTWLGTEGWSVSRLVPVQSGQAVLDRPPGLTWMQMAAFASLPGGEATLQQQVLRARLLGVGMSLVTLGALFWIGMSLGGLRTATFAAMVLLANPLLVLAGRSATAEAVTVGWITLAMAAALWAIRPMRPAPKLWRQAFGWAICGAAAGAGLLCGGLIVMPLLGVPLVVIAMTCPRRISHGLGLVAAGSIAGLMTLPWTIYVLQADHAMWSRLGSLWDGRLDAGVALASMGPLGVLLLLGTGVWVLMMLVGWVWPWTPGSRESRRRMLVGWTWAACCGASLLLVCFASSMAMWKLTSVVMTTMVVMAMLVAQMLTRFGDVAREGGVARGWRWLRWPTAAWVLGLSLIGPMLLYLRTADLGSARPWYWLGTAVVLVLLGFMGASWATRPYPGRAVACWAVWSVAAVSLVIIPSSTLSVILPGRQPGYASLLNQLDQRRTTTPAATTPASPNATSAVSPVRSALPATTASATHRQHDAP